jgi:glycosyltransferase involved in cell wall biosynthesis
MEAPGQASPDVAIILPNLASGGAERVCLALASAFTADGLSVEMVLREKRGDLLEAVPPGVTVRDLAAPRVRQALRPLVGYLRERRPRAVLSAMWPLNSLVLWARSMSGIDCRAVTSDHNILSLSAQGRPGIRRLLMRVGMAASYGSADGVVGVSQGVADDIARLSGLSPSRISVIYNPITPLPPAQPADPAAMARWSGGGPRLVTVGTLKAVKDHATLLRALVEVRRKADARLLIVGDGPDRAAVEAMIAAMGLQDAVTLAGFHPTPHAYVAQADAFVLSSRSEGFGNVLVEAMACGVPVVSTDCPSGPREILDGGRYGLLTPVGDAAALADAIMRTLEQPMPCETLLRRSEDFSVSRAAAAYRALLGV